MTSDPDTVVVILTPAGRGAVATVLIAGPRALKLAGGCFHSASGRGLSTSNTGQVLFGRWQSATDGEEVVVCQRSSQRVEIHCHGGLVAASAIVASLVEQGCQQLAWRDWLRGSHGDTIAAAASILLADVVTRRAAAVLWDQQQGALTRALAEIEAHVARGAYSDASSAVSQLLDFAPLGLHLVQPWRVVLTGRPNVGKSSLINALLGYGRAIVHPTPGTTRDVVTAESAFDGWPVELSDTAGIHASDDPLEAAGMALAEASLAAADLVVFVHDATEPWSETLQHLADRRPNALRVANKSDLTSKSESYVRPMGMIEVSALTGQGIAELSHAVARRLVPQTPASGQAVPFTAGQVAALQRLRATLADKNSADALALLAARDSWSGISAAV